MEWVVNAWQRISCSLMVFALCGGSGALAQDQNGTAPNAETILGRMAQARGGKPEPPSSLQRHPRLQAVRQGKNGHARRR